jgi:hypothetical protein
MTIIGLIGLLVNESLTAPGKDKATVEHILNGMAYLLLYKRDSVGASLDTQRSELVEKRGILIRLHINTNDYNQYLTPVC